MMQRMMDKFMELEVAHKTGAEKGLMKKALRIQSRARRKYYL